MRRRWSLRTAQSSTARKNIKDIRNYAFSIREDTSGACTDRSRSFLIPEHREPDTIGPRGGRKKGRIIERRLEYIADFTYEELRPDGSWVYVVEDCKGMRTREYIIKRKLMLHVYNIRLRET